MKPNRHIASQVFRSPSPSASTGTRRPRTSRHASCIALVDDRFTSWLVYRECDPGAEPELSRRGLVRTLSRIANGTGLDLSFRRVYWYTDRPDGQLFDEQLVRSAVEGEETWALLERDLRRLAEWQSCETVLIACDDERLLPAIDDAQLRGLSVIMLADEGVLDFSLLRQEDPEWALLLSQADRRLTVRPEDLSDLKPLPNGEDRGADAQSAGREHNATIEEVVRSWWGSQSEESREELRVALAQSTGIPQEVDRELLLQSRERFVRPLSFLEKKQMRSCLRGIAGGDSADSQSSASG